MKRTDLLDELYALHPNEAKGLLLQMLEQAERYDELLEKEHTLQKQILEIWNGHLARKRAETEEKRGHVHIVMGLSDAGALKCALNTLGRRKESEIFAFSDCFSGGPVSKLETDEGRKYRLEWMSERFRGYMHAQYTGIRHGLDTVLETIRAISAEKEITIWTGWHAHEQIGMRLALAVLQDAPNHVYIGHISELYEGIAGRFDPVPHSYAFGFLTLEAIEEIVRLHEERKQPLSMQARQAYIREWEELSATKAKLHIYSDGKIVQADEDSYDEALMTLIAKMQLGETGGEQKFIPASRVIMEALECWENAVMVEFIEYRLWTLISGGRLRFKGVPAAMQSYGVALAESP
ncbi:DUF1835 domain-containing protein [Paenibacillus sp. UNC499MF]|uniref:DUF1835 domain-containing protein n=1 Tax=Paenibacillus sp. UNC499MF TaxID=1502751 RepID=UPI00089F97DF|nr:DUF1835 domain-containing protein [Paenibacillus sp. UNC499MF]SEG45422.1 Protein of unknown function [Paenibacillus sp. UNC499MF]